MSEQSRNDAGQFTPAEPLYGLALQEHEAGFTPMSDRPKEETQETDGSETALRDAAARINERRNPDGEVIDRGYRTHNGQGDPVDPKLTISRERMAGDIAAARAREAQVAEEATAIVNGAEIDVRRAELLQQRPELAHHLDPNMARYLADHVLPERTTEEPEANPADDGKSAEEPTDAKRKAERQPKAEPAPEGVDPTLWETVRNHPQVKQELEAEYTRAHETTQRADQALQSGVHLAQATFATMFPEAFSGDPAWLQRLSPERQQQAAQALQVGAQLEQHHAQRQQQQAQYQAYQQQEQIKAYKAEQEAVFEKHTDVPREQWPKYAKALADHAQKFGLDPETIYREAQSNFALNHAAFQTLMVDGLKWQEAQKAKTNFTKPVPPVQRPGTQQSRAPVNSNTSKIAALEKQFAAAKGDKQAKIMAQIRSLKRAG